jgi:hypothetical protein
MTTQTDTRRIGGYANKAERARLNKLMHAKFPDSYPLPVQENYHAQAAKLAEALRGMMKTFAWRAEITVQLEGESALQSDVRKARQALAEYEAAQ